MMEDNRNHWDRIYSSKKPSELSWTEEVPKTSLDFIHSAHLGKDSSIIDIGGGDSKLVDFLLDEGFENISVLDISEQALTRTKLRLGDKASKVTWIVNDINDFHPETSYDFWHDRATFHFLISEPQITTYLSIAREAVKENGFVTIGTFSTEGPDRCSGLPVKQYNEETLGTELENGFEKIKCITEDHKTPFNVTQKFLFCSFIRRASRHFL